MTKLIHMTGDIFTSTAPAIGHGVNTYGVMGSGIAVQFRNRFPEMYNWYHQFCLETDYSLALRPGQVFWYEDKPSGRWIANIASQDKPGANARIEWLRQGVESALKALDASGGLDRLALPRIGAGVGGLDWAEVEQVLTELAEAHKADIEVWTLPTAS